MTATQTAIETVDLVIVGSGPAGVSTALHLVRADRSWTERTVVLDRAVHPRVKLCGGGVTRPAEAVLQQLGLGLPPEQVPIRELRLVFGGRAWAARGEPVFRVVQRSELDHWLVRAAVREGVELRQGERVDDVVVGASGVEVRTARTVYKARAVVGADGSKGTVRRRLGWSAGERQARLLEVLTPEAPPSAAGSSGSSWRGVAVFDFTPMGEGLRGYYWDFPSLVGGRPMMNRGVFDSRIGGRGPGRPLKEVLAAAMERRGRELDAGDLAGHPLLWFDRTARVSGPRVLLAGDAAGADPLFGEGISFALAHGRVAAAALVDAFAGEDFGFEGYRARLTADPVLGHLPRRERLARWSYALGRALGWRPVWALVPWATRLLTSYRPGILPLESGRLERVQGGGVELFSGA